MQPLRAGHLVRIHGVMPKLIKQVGEGWVDVGDVRGRIRDGLRQLTLPGRMTRVEQRGYEIAPPDGSPRVRFYVDTHGV
jgi:hypothetical protein